MPVLRGEHLFLLVLVVVAPLLLAKFLIRANWLQCGAAFLVLWGVLLLFGLLSGGTLGERLGWPMILAIFTTLPGVPIIALLMKRFGFLA